MAILRQALFNDGTDGTVVTAANESGLTATSEGNFTYTTESYEGAFAARSPLGDPARLELGLASDSPSVYARGYFKRKAGTQNIQFFHTRNSDVSIVAQVRWNATTGKLQIRDALTAVATSTYTWPVEEWVRIEWYVNRAGGTQECRLFYGANITGASGSPDESLTGTCTSGTAASVRTVQVGLNVYASDAVILVDAFAVGDSWVGPSITDNSGSYSVFEWNGTSEVPVSIQGVWDGSTVVSAELEGTWDGTSVS